MGPAGAMIAILSPAFKAGGYTVSPALAEGIMVFTMKNIMAMAADVSRRGLRLIFILCRVGNSCFDECLATLGACAAASAVDRPTLVA